MIDRRNALTDFHIQTAIGQTASQQTIGTPLIDCTDTPRIIRLVFVQAVQIPRIVGRNRCRNAETSYKPMSTADSLESINESIVSDSRSDGHTASDQRNFATRQRGRLSRSRGFCAECLPAQETGQ